MTSEQDVSRPPPGRKEIVGNCEIYQGDCRDVLHSLPADSIHCCVTSPPYFGLRNYGHDAQIGLESTPTKFIAELVSVFRELRRVLRPDGTLWINIGDSYAGSSKGGNPGNSEHVKQKTNDGSLTVRNRKQDTPGIKPKDLIGIPWMLAFALRSDGWFLRQEIIWYKANPMPESVTDRCTKTHEYIFLLSKNERYYFDQEAILEPCSPNTHARLSQNVEAQIGSSRANGGAKTNGNMKAVGRKFDPAAGNKNNPSFDAAMALMPNERNKRSVWTVTTMPYKGAHFATYPPKLIEPCILASTWRHSH